MSRASYVSSYTTLSQDVQAAGLHRRCYTFYWTWMSSVVLGVAGVWTGVILLGDSWFQLLLAAALAVLLAQVGFLGHDAAHRQIFASAAWNEWTARVLSGAVAGLSYGWWLRKHNRHHSGPNQIDRDPDISSGILVIDPTRAQAASWVPAWFARRQGWWLFALLPFEGINLHVQSVRSVLGRRPVPRRWAEIGLLSARLLGYVAALAWLLPPGKAVAFLGVQLAVFGVLLGGAFAPNHIGRPIVPAGLKVDFLRRQVLMSRNISGGMVVEVLMGGLNHQIEHHLFPSMPRPNLRRARPLVQAHCEALGVAYTRQTVRHAYRDVIAYLNVVGTRGMDPFRCPLVSLYRG